MVLVVAVSKAVIATFKGFLKPMNNTNNIAAWIVGIVVFGGFFLVILFSHIADMKEERRKREKEQKLIEH